MAMRKVTFTIPDEVLTPFLRSIPSSRRSHYVTDAIRRRLREQEEALAAACDAVNADPELNALIDDWQAFSDPIEEPWVEPAAR
ncbi:MAG: hypothetical protein M3R43_09520 [Acidobacteriota bacterium]|nr:hypothetical protein [Acidobacteriota bacterium]